MSPGLANRRGAFAWLPWIAASALLHAALVLSLLLAGGAQPIAPERARALRVQLLREAPGPAASAVAAAPIPVAAAAPPPKPARRPTARPVASKPPPAAAPAIALEPAPAAGAEAPALTGEPAGAVSIAAVVSSGPPGEAPGGDALAAYVARVRDAIARHKRYPSLARRRGIEGRVVLQLSIASDGSVVSSEAVGSAPAVLARSALAAVASASPFEPPPAGSLRIEVPIRYALHEDTRAIP